VQEHTVLSNANSLAPVKLQIFLVHEPGVHLEEGADVVERARHELADDDAVGALP
jgi:hypothetical protein